MTGKGRWWFTGGVALAIICGAAAPAAAGLSDTDRAQKWEFYVPLRWIGSESYSADGGTTLDLNPDLGWGFGFGYNINDYFEVQGDFTWQDANFDATIVTDNPVGTTTLGGSLDATTLFAAVQYNIMNKTFTPFIVAGVGWTWVDTNIPTGPPVGTCWWSPWYGYICSTWQPTATESAFNYGAGVGLRGEVTESFYLELSYNWSWNDFEVVDSFEGFRLDIGWKF